MLCLRSHPVDDVRVFDLKPPSCPTSDSRTTRSPCSTMKALSNSESRFSNTKTRGPTDATTSSTVASASGSHSGGAQW